MKRTNKGFTLVELMVVIVIIGVLASLAIPKFQEASAKAKVSEAPTVCGSFDNAALARIGEVGTGAASFTDLVMQDCTSSDYSKFFTYAQSLGAAVDQELTASPNVAMGDVATSDDMGTRVNIEPGNKISHWQAASYDKYLPNWGKGTTTAEE
ncbi:MAG: prepilin-type N-terminal cleavage/methylation domain-containing protein [Chitinispirillaceae bacterium]|nr:prepilin-type N-terminal cleavage/methylation domain-containing protein [Chitinispirillaceae bacterium]